MLWLSWLRLLQGQPHTPPPCICGHPFEWHQHYRDRDDCGACLDCHTYRRPRTTLADWLWLARALLAVWRTRR